MGDYELPASSKPWKIRVYGTAIVFVNEEHEPMVLADGRFEVLRLRLDARRVMPNFDPRVVPKSGSWMP